MSESKRSEDNIHDDKKTPEDDSRITLKLNESKMGDVSLDEDLFMSILGYLEDMLLEPVSFDADDDEEDDWNQSSGKEGESIREEIKEFNAQAVENFVKCLSDTDIDENFEYKLEHMELHKKYCNLIEEPLHKVLEKFNCSIETFYRQITCALDSKEPKSTWMKAGAKEIIQMINEVNDFQLWAAEILNKAQIVQKMNKKK